MEPNSTNNLAGAGNGGQQAPPQQNQQTQGQQQQGNQPSLPLIPPGIPQGVQHQAPVQQQQQQQQAQQQPAQTFTADAVYDHISRSMNVPVEHVRRQAQQMGITNPLEFVAALSKDAWGVMEQSRSQQQQIVPPQQQQQTQTVGQFQLDPKKPVPLPEGWQSVVRANADGVYEPIAPMYKQYADLANHNRIVEASKLQSFAQNPESYFDDPNVQAKIDQRAKAIAAEQVQELRREQMREKYRTQYTKDLVQHDENGKPVFDMQGKPMLTQFGVVYNKHANALASGGMQESDQFYQTAYALARNELGVANTVSNMQQQYQYGQQQGYQGQQQGQQQQQGGNAITTMLQNANTWFPQSVNQQGQQQGQPQLTMAGALYNVLADAPEGMSAGQYFDHIGPIFKQTHR